MIYRFATISLIQLIVLFNKSYAYQASVHNNGNIILSSSTKQNLYVDSTQIRRLRRKSWEYICVKELDLNTEKKCFYLKSHGNQSRFAIGDRIEYLVYSPKGRVLNNKGYIDIGRMRYFYKLIKAQRVNGRVVMR